VAVPGFVLDCRGSRGVRLLQANLVGTTYMTWSIALLTIIMAAAAFYLSIAFVLVYIAIQLLHWTFLVAGIVLLGVSIVIWVRALKG
jgi:hypothetical protein